MSGPKHHPSAFKSCPPELESRVLAITKKYKDDQPLQRLFLDLSMYIEGVRDEAWKHGFREGQGKPPASSSPSKKRKLEATDHPDIDTFDSIADVSFSIPQRKKFKLELGRTVLTATNQSTREIECGVQWTEVDYCICVPVPEKAQPQYNFCIFTHQPPDEQILFTVPGTAIKPETVFSKDLPISEGETYKDVTIKMLNKRLPKRKVVQPDEKDFVSQLAQAHRKGEKAVHVKAFRGSKEGTLLLPP